MESVVRDGIMVSMVTTKLCCAVKATHSCLRCNKIICNECWLHYELYESLFNRKECLKNLEHMYMGYDIQDDPEHTKSVVGLRKLGQEDLTAPHKETDSAT